MAGGFIVSNTPIPSGDSLNFGIYLKDTTDIIYDPGSNDYYGAMFYVTSSNDSIGYVGIETNEIDVTTFNVYPNPATDVINVESNSNLPISIYNTAGVMILQTEPNVNVIDIYDLPRGIYIINDGINNKKFIKQ
jgi:hypothetical protein